MRSNIEKYQTESNCHACDGLRLKKEALAVKINGLNIGQLCQKSIKESLS